MALYSLNYLQYSHTLDAPTKAKALKGWYDILITTLGPEGVTFKVFVKGATAMRQKVVKVDTWQCPVDQQRFNRKEFVSHVRMTHS